MADVALQVERSELVFVGLHTINVYEFVIILYLLFVCEFQQRTKLFALLVDNLLNSRILLLRFLSHFSYFIIWILYLLVLHQLFNQIVIFVVLGLVIRNGFLFVVLILILLIILTLIIFSLLVFLLLRAF